MASSVPNLKYLQNIVFLLLAVNILPSLSEEYSGLLSNLYKKASDQNRPLILVLDNNADRNPNYKESETQPSSYKSKSIYPVNSNYKSSSYSNRNERNSHIDNRKEDGQYPIAYIYQLAKQVIDQLNQDTKPSKSNQYSSHSSYHGNNQNAWEDRDRNERARDYEDRKDGDYRVYNHYSADKYYKQDRSESMGSNRGSSHHKSRSRDDSNNRGDNYYRESNRGNVNNRESKRGDNYNRGSYRAVNNNRGSYRDNNNRGSYRSNNNNRGSYGSDYSNKGSNSNNNYYRGDNRLDSDYRGDNRGHRERGDRDYRGDQEKDRYDNKLLKSPLVKTLMDISNNLRQRKDSCENDKNDECTTTPRYENKSDACETSGSCADSDQTDKHPSTRAELWDQCLDKPKTCNSLKK